MSAVDRVLAALRRLQPPRLYSDDDGSEVVSELRAIAAALGVPAERIDTLLTTFLPSVADELLDRWEKIVGVTSRPTDALGVRQARVVGRLRRSRGFTHDRVSSVVAPSLAIDPSEAVYLEADRAEIEAGIIDGEQFAAPFALPVPGTLSRTLGTPWPGNVDYSGVRLRIVLQDAPGVALTIRLTHADGSAWTFWNNFDIGDFGDQTFLIAAPALQAFTGKPAAGPWTLKFTTAATTHAPALLQWSLMVSGGDAAQIYHWHLRRDPSLPGVADLREAQRLVRKTATAERLGRVCERAIAIVDDAHSLCDREPVG